jgi:hypothetical protein
LLKTLINFRNVLRACAPLVACMSGFLGLRYWLAATGRAPTLFDDKTSEILGGLTSIGPLIARMFGNFFAFALYLGLFLLPLLLLSAAGLYRARDKRGITALVLGIVIMGGGVTARIANGETVLLPFMHNVLVKSGIGPLTLRDTFVLELQHVPGLSIGFWGTVTAAGLLGGVLLIATLGIHAANQVQKLLRRQSLGDAEIIGAFLMLCGIIYLPPLLVGPVTFDRYLIPLIFFFAVGTVALSRQYGKLTFSVAMPWRFAAFSLLAAFGLFAIASTRDYLAWNRVRWIALEDLTRNAHVHARDIDGGFEFNGLYLYDPNKPLDYTRMRNKFERSWWWVQGDTYQIGFGAVPGYRVVKEYAYTHWLPWHVQKLVVQRKQE